MNKKSFYIAIIFLWAATMMNSIAGYQVFKEISQLQLNQEKIINIINKNEKTISRMSS